MDSVIYRESPAPAPRGNQAVHAKALRKASGRYNLGHTGTASVCRALTKVIKQRALEQRITQARVIVLRLVAEASSPI